MAGANEDMTMRLRRITAVETINSEIALKLAEIKLAEMVFTHHYGRNVVDAQSPLEVVDGGDHWVVRGGKVQPSSLDVRDPIGGRLIISIMKVDGRITELTRELVSDN